MTPEEKAAHDALVLELKNKIEAAITEKAASKAELKPISDKIIALEEKSKEVKNPEDYETLKAEHAKLVAEVKALGESSKAKSEKKSLKDELKEKATEIKSLAKGVSANEIELKTLAQRSDIANNQQAYDLPEIGQLATRKLSLYDIFPKFSVGDGNNNGVIRYYDWDEDTIARAAAAVAEGAAFPEATAKFKKGSVSMQKIGAILPVTEEFFEDAQMFAAELEGFLAVDVALEIDRQLADGDGTSNTIVGLKSSINAYTLPGTGTVVDASIYDLIVKLSEAITTTGGAKYQPDFAVMHIADINRMKLKKDANNNYVLPPFVSRDGNQVSTITVFESNIITANTMVIGDRRFARIYEKPGVVLSKGFKGDQFIEDEMTLKARKRLAFLIRAADKAGFLKVTDIDAALAAITIV